MMEYLETDSRFLFDHMKKEEKRLIQKRRWLLGLPSSHNQNMASKDPKFFKELTLPESFLRDDDPFIDKLKNALKNSHTRRMSGRPNPKIYKLFENHINSSDLIKLLLSDLNNMTNTCLIELTSTLTTNPSPYIRTRKNMKNFIRNHLRELLKKQKSGTSDDGPLKKLSKFLRDCNNFKNMKGFLSERFVVVEHHVFHRILNNLEFAPLHILNTMMRKLGCIGNQERKRKHVDLVCDIRHTCLNMIVEGRVGEEGGYVLPDVLAMTMDCFVRSMEPLLGSNSLEDKLYRFSPGKEALMDEIVMALHMMQKRMRFTKLDKLRHVLDINEVGTNRSVRPSIKDALIDYLFDCCGDADESVPDSLIEFLKSINGSHHTCSASEIEEGVECVLSVGANVKQILWDSLLDHDIDQDFADAFMEDLEDSDEGEFECTWMIRDSHKTEIDDPCSSAADEFVVDVVDVKPFQKVDVSHEYTKGEAHEDAQITPGNEYLDVQDVCDNVSAIAFSLIGCLLDRYGRMEGSDFCPSTRSYLKHDILKLGDIEVSEDEEGDYILQVVKTLIPEFPESGLMKLDELMKI